MGPAEEFLARYGEKGYHILKAAISVSRARMGGPRLGDFSYKDIKEYLERNGIKYNPSLLLSRLEKEYGLIETTYKSGGQHWWRITNWDEIERAIAQYEGEDPGENELPYKARLLKIQFYSLNPERIMEILLRLKKRKRLSEAERRLLQKIVFEDLPRLVSFLEEASAEFPDELEPEIMTAESIMDIVESLTVPQRSKDASRAEILEYPTLRRYGKPL